MAKPTWFECITLAAIMLGPVLALFTQRLLDHLRENKERRVQLFLTLMRTRATPLAPDHVNALNSIDVVFDGGRDQKVRDAWSKLLAHVVKDTAQPDCKTDTTILRLICLEKLAFGLAIPTTPTTSSGKSIIREHSAMLRRML